MSRLVYKLIFTSAAIPLLLALSACTVDGDPVAIDPVSLSGLSSSSAASSSSAPEDSLSSSAEPTSSAGMDDVERDTSVYSMLDFVGVPGGKLKMNTTEFLIDGFTISAIEVTQAAYKGAMGKLPSQPRQGDDYPVVNVSWFDAVLFCNALSKMLGLDTAYVYASVGDKKGNCRSWCNQWDLLLGYGQGYEIRVLRTNFGARKSEGLYPERVWTLRHGG